MDDHASTIHLNSDVCIYIYIYITRVVRIYLSYVHMSFMYGTCWCIYIYVCLHINIYIHRYVRKYMCIIVKKCL